MREFKPRFLGEFFTRLLGSVLTEESVEFRAKCDLALKAAVAQSCTQLIEGNRAWTPKSDQISLFQLGPHNIK